jgi:hypothetical protein
VVNTKTGVPLASIMGAAQSISGVNLGAQYASNLGTATLRAAVSITTRVIDMETGEVVFMCSGNGTAKGKTQLAAEYGALGGTLINGGVGGFKQTVTGQAIEKAFATIGNSLNDYFDGQVTQRVISHSATNQDTQLFARGTTLYMGSHKLQSEEVSDVFVNAPQLYFDYKKGKSMATWSVPLMIVGGLTTLMCGISYIVNSSIDYQQGEGSQSELLAGTIVGVAALGGGIYLRSLGTNKINIAVDEYNTYHSISYNKALQPHLYLIAGGGGLGLRLTF